jgi:RimJ/RimL family protein N-acetyltransferase
MSAPLPGADSLFETPRLRCRPCRESDLAALLAVYGDARAMAGVDDGEPLSAEDCARWLQITQDNDRRQRSGMLALVSRESGEVAGFCGLVQPDAADEVELKFALLRSQWGQGLATEMLPALLDWGLQRHGFARVSAICVPENTHARRVLEKAGFCYVEMRAEDDGRLMDVLAWQAGPALPAAADGVH